MQINKVVLSLAIVLFAFAASACIVKQPQQAAGDDAQPVVVEPAADEAPAVAKAPLKVAKVPARVVKKAPAPKVGAPAKTAVKKDGACGCGGGGGAGGCGGCGGGCGK